MLNVDSASFNMGAEVVESDRKVLGTWACLMIGSNLDAGFVIFEDTAVDFRSWVMNVKAIVLDILEWVHNVNDFTQRSRQDNVFRLSGT